MQQAFRFIDGSSFADASEVHIRFYEPKENTRDDMNPHNRPNTEAARVDFSSTVKIRRPVTSVVPWFETFDAYMAITADRKPPEVKTSNGPMTRLRLFYGCFGKFQALCLPEGQARSSWHGSPP